MGFITRPDFSRQIKQYSGTTAELSGSTRIKQNLDVLGSISGNTISGGTFYSGSTDLSKLFSTIVNSIGDYVNISGDTMTGKLNLSDLSATTINSTNFTGITLSSTTISATTIYGNSSNPYFYKTAGGTFSEGVNGVSISNGNLKGTTVSATTFMDFQPQSSLPDAAPGRLFFSGGTFNAMMYCSGTTANDWVVMNKTGFI